jgi:hypothetical protein
MSNLELEGTAFWGPDGENLRAARRAQATLARMAECDAEFGPLITGRWLSISVDAAPGRGAVGGPRALRSRPGPVPGGATQRPSAASPSSPVDGTQFGVAVSGRREVLTFQAGAVRGGLVEAVLVDEPVCADGMRPGDRRWWPLERVVDWCLDTVGGPITPRSGASARVLRENRSAFVPVIRAWEQRQATRQPAARPGSIVRDWAGRN